MEVSFKIDVFFQEIDHQYFQIHLHLNRDDIRVNPHIN